MTGTSGSLTGRVRMLIVDDEPALNEVLSVAGTVAVTEPGRRRCPALDGWSVLSTARGCAPHGVVLDGMPPDPDGHQVPLRPRHENPKPRVLSRRAGVPVHLRASVSHTVRDLGYGIRAAEDGR